MADSRPADEVEGVTCRILYMYIYVTKITRLVSSWSKNSWKSIHGAFLSHLDVVNVTVDYQFTPGQALLLFLRSCLCPLRVAGARVHTCSVIGRCVVMPTTMLTWWVRCQLLTAVCSWHLQCSKYFTDTQYSASTGYVFCGTLVLSEVGHTSLAYLLPQWLHANKNNGLYIEKKTLLALRH